MKSEIKSIVREVIKELMGGGSSVNGAASFRGGPYGIGAKKQLANTLDPSVQAMEDQEQAELNKNLDRQAYSNHKFPAGPPEPMAERNDADMNSGHHLPGFPAMNALEAPVQHLPNENLPPSDLRAGSQDGTEDYIIDDIIDELESEGEPGYNNYIRKEGAQAGSNLPNQQQAALPPQYVDPDEREDDLGHMSQDNADSSPAGGYGAILHPRKFVPDEMPQTSSLLDVDMDGIEDSIDQDQPSELYQKVKENVEEGKRQKHKSGRSKERYGVKEPSGAQIAKKFKDARRAVMELGVMLGDSSHGEITGLMRQLNDMARYSSVTAGIDEDAVDEEYKSKAQQGYFHAKAAEGDPEFKELAAEFDDDTTAAEFKNLPARAPKKEALNSESIKRLVREEIQRQIADEED